MVILNFYIEQVEMWFNIANKRLCDFSYCRNDVNKLKIIVTFYIALILIVNAIP